MGFAIPAIAAVAFTPAVSTTLATGVFGLASSTVFTNVLAGALIGAATSAITGGDPLSGALFGGLGAGLGSVFGLGGFGEEAAAAGEMGAQSTLGAPGAEGALAGVDASQLASGQALSGGVDTGGLAGGAQSAIEQSIGQTQSAIGDFGAKANPFAPGLNDAMGSSGLGAGGAETGAGIAAEPLGLLDKLLSDQGAMSALKEAGRYTMGSDLWSQRAEEEGEQDRKTAREAAAYSRHGIVGADQGNPILDNSPALSSNQMRQLIQQRPGAAKWLPYYMPKKPYGNVGQSQPLYPTTGYHAPGSLPT